MPLLTDEHLVERLRAGDDQALGILYERYSRAVYAFCLQMLRDQQSAEDVAQETFLKLRSAIRSLQSIPAFKVWLFQIARNEVLQTLRRTRRNSTVEHDDVWDPDTPHKLAEREEVRELVQQCLSSLKVEYREVLILREYDRLSYAEIAAVTGTTESSVKSRIFKARKALVKRLEPYFGGKEH